MCASAVSSRSDLMSLVRDGFVPIQQREQDHDHRPYGAAVLGRPDYIGPTDEEAHLGRLLRIWVFCAHRRRGESRADRQGDDRSHRAIGPNCIQELALLARVSDCARDHRRMPPGRLGEIRRASFDQARHRFREQMAVAEPGHRAQQSGAEVLQRDRHIRMACVSCGFPADFRNHDTIFRGSLNIARQFDFSIPQD